MLTGQSKACKTRHHPTCASLGSPGAVKCGGSSSWVRPPPPPVSAVERGQRRASINPTVFVPLGQVEFSLSPLLWDHRDSREVASAVPPLYFSSRDLGWNEASGLISTLVPTRYQDVPAPGPEQGAPLLSTSQPAPHLGFSLSNATPGPSPYRPLDGK